MTSLNPHKNSWQRFKKNKLAFAALIFIVLTVLVSIFAYQLAPDNSPNADLQTVEIQAKPPGYTQLFLKVNALREAGKSRFAGFFTGTPPAFTYLPITGYRIESQTLVVDKYLDESVSVPEKFDINRLTNKNPSQIENYIVRKKYWLGTDAFGRDILSRLIIGTRVSLAVGMIALLISLTLGILLGSLGGYYRGRVDDVIGWMLNVTWSIPTLLLAFAITMALGKGFWQVFVAVGLTMWVNVARLVRGQVMAIKELEFVQAARVLGYNDKRILMHHILPNTWGPLLVIAAGNFASAIIIEAGLSFLGIGVQPPVPSWGLMIKENYNFIITHSPFLALVPGIAIMLLVLAFNLVGNGLRDAADIKE